MKDRKDRNRAEIVPSVLLSRADRRTEGPEPPLGGSVFRSRSCWSGFGPKQRGPQHPAAASGLNAASGAPADRGTPRPRGGVYRFEVVRAETAHPQLTRGWSHRGQSRVVVSHYENPGAFTATVKPRGQFDPPPLHRYPALLPIVAPRARAQEPTSLIFTAEVKPQPVSECRPQLRVACDTSLSNWKSKEGARDVG
jgi:hypothetical protein